GHLSRVRTTWSYAGSPTRHASADGRQLSSHRAVVSRGKSCGCAHHRHHRSLGISDAHSRAHLANVGSIPCRTTRAAHSVFTPHGRMVCRLTPLELSNPNSAALADDSFLHTLDSNRSGSAARSRASENPAGHSPHRVSG